jgi:hypothetical protein
MRQRLPCQQATPTTFDFGVNTKEIPTCNCLTWREPLCDRASVYHTWVEGA